VKVNGCARCGQLVFFENSACLRCCAPLGFDPGRGRMITLVPVSGGPDGDLDGVLLELPRVAVVAAELGDARTGAAAPLPAPAQPAAVAAEDTTAAVPLAADTTAAAPAAEDVAAGVDPISRDLLAAVPYSDRRGFRRCAAADLAGCNWVVPVPASGAGAGAGAGSGSGADGPAELCVSCRLTRTRPADDDTVGRERFARAEAAKRRLVAQLLELGLPVVAHRDDPARGLAFDLLNSTEHPVVTGHSDGLITLDLAESDDAHRELVRTQLGEPYRTLLGHFRHEVGHYYWSSLAATDPERAARFRALFGDPDIDYVAALECHYDEGPPEHWHESYVSAYATMHPWEDWAETFAHYLHIRDTLRTAAEFGLRVEGPDLAAFGVTPRRHAAEPGGHEGIDGTDGTDDVRGTGRIEGSDGIDGIVAQWLPLTYALNAINRSMGRDDLYPFVLTPRVRAKLAYVHEVIDASAARVTSRATVGAAAGAGAASG
jgi:hypothetical protein